MIIEKKCICGCAAEIYVKFSAKFLNYTDMAEIMEVNETNAGKQILSPTNNDQFFDAEDGGK